MRSDKMSSIYAAEVSRRVYHARFILRACVLLLATSMVFLTQERIVGVTIERPSRDPISAANETHTNGRMSGLDLWILPNFLDF
jgi:hypothetical protein